MTVMEQAVSEQDLWQALSTRLRAYVGARVAPAFVDDLVGEILLRLVEHRAELEGAERPSAWMLRVASNAVTDHYRRRAAEQRALDRVRATAAPATPNDGSVGDSAATQLARCLIPFIHALPVPYREALLLTEIEGVTQKEAASRLGISVSGMKSRVQRGREKLKRSLLECCEIHVDARGGVTDYERRPERPAGECGPQGCAETGA